jgi:hypothetical protein
MWVSFAPLERTPRGYSSKVASVRYRVTATAAALAAAGVESKVTALGQSANRRTLFERFQGIDAVILGKLLAPPEAFARETEKALELVTQLRARKIAVLADYSDDHFADPLQGPGYRALANAVDRVIASTPALAQTAQQYTAVPVSVVTDLVEGPRGEPQVAQGASIELLWFGHPVNFDTLDHGLPQLERVRSLVPYRLTLLTQPGRGEEIAAAIGARFEPWSSAGLFQLLARCDVAIIPSNPYDPRKAVKSPNRFAETVWAGRFALAHPLPAYEALAPGGWVGDDLGAGLEWYAANRAAALERIRAGQSLIVGRHSPAAVATAWKRVIEETVQRA